MAVETASHRLALLVGGASLRDRGRSGPMGTKSKQVVDQETSQELTKNKYCYLTYLLRVAIRTNVFELVIIYDIYYNTDDYWFAIIMFHQPSCCAHDDN